MASDKDIQITEDGASSLHTEDQDESMDEKIIPGELKHLTGKTLTFNHDEFPWRNIMIIEGSNPIYYADISVFTPNKPDITLRRSDSNGPIVGQAHFRWSFSIKAGVGSSDIGMDWANLERGGYLYKRNYAFDWQGRTYSFRRTRSSQSGVLGVAKAMLSHMKITDDKTGQPIAVYLSQPGVARKRGTLHLAENMSPELEIICMLGVAAWREKVARATGRYTG